MDLRDFGSTLARWWYLTVATLLLAIGAGAGAYAATGPSYTANSTVLLLPPKAVLLAAQEDKKNYAPNNPLLYLSTLTDARDVLVRHLNSTDVVDQLKKTAPGATVAVSGDLTSGSPLILVKSQASSAETAIAGMKAVDSLVPGSLKAFQDQMKIGDVQRINSLQITEDSKPTAVHKSQIMMAVVAFAGITVLGLAAIALLDQLRNRRTRGDAVTTGRAHNKKATVESTRPAGTTEARTTTGEDGTARAARAGATSAARAPGNRSANRSKGSRA